MIVWTNDIIHLFKGLVSARPLLPASTNIPRDCLKDCIGINLGSEYGDVNNESSTSTK